MGLSSCTENQLLIVLFDKKFCVTIFTRCLFVCEAVESSQTLFIIYIHIEMYWRVTFTEEESFLISE